VYSVGTARRNARRASSKPGNHHLPKFGWTGPGYEYPLMWGLIMFAVATRGGGPWSLDRKIGWQL